jgi:hypothetical protein
MAISQLLMVLQKLKKSVISCDSEKSLSLTTGYYAISPDGRMTTGKSGLFARLPTLGLTLQEIRLCYGDFIAEYHQAFIRGLTF